MLGLALVWFLEHNSMYVNSSPQRLCHTIAISYCQRYQETTRCQCRVLHHLGHSLTASAERPYASPKSMRMHPEVQI